MKSFASVLAFGVAYLVGARGYTQFVLGAILCYPALVQSIALYAKVFPLRYVFRHSVLLSLFPH